MQTTKQICADDDAQRTAIHTATHCNTLQHTATRCNTLQHAATHCNGEMTAAPCICTVATADDKADFCAKLRQRGEKTQGGEDS